MSDLPEPLNQPECDLRGYEYMPLFGARLFSSTFDAKATDREFRAAMRLWWASWQECPAGSLPNDDDVLCKAALLGRDLKAWFKIKDRALHGFIECSDGRLYHPLLADKAREAYARRKKERDRKADMRARKVSGQQGGQDADVPRDNPGTDHGQDADKTRMSFAGRGEDRRGEDKEERKKESTPKPSRALVASDDDPAFAAFWSVYPRKDDKGHARKAWVAARRKAEPEAIIAGAQGYQFNENPRFIPLPATWLDGERWLQVAENDGFDPVLRAAGVTQADLDHHFGRGDGPTIFQTMELLQ